MRPVNLIPPDERGGDRSSMRTGAFSYVLIGALAIALLGVIALAFTSKQISDRKSEVAKLQVQEQQAEAKAQSLQAFANFRAVQEQRSATITSLAQSRFDWQRVLNELARVIPSDVWLVQLPAPSTPRSRSTDGPEITIRDGVTGPALELVGCAPSQDAVAGLVADLEEIDGVTRVGLQRRRRLTTATPPAAPRSTSASGERHATTECRTSDFIAKFEIVVAFDAVPFPSDATDDAVRTVFAGPDGVTRRLASQSSATPRDGRLI